MDDQAPSAAEGRTGPPPPLMQAACSTGSISGAGQPLHRPHAFDKMEELVREMLDPENGVRVRTQKMFLTFIPFAFIGYDLIEWLMDRLIIEESEALNIANQLCQHGYFFPVSDSKNLVVKDDSSYYRFQVPYYWPWQNRPPDNVEYAIYLLKRSMRNRQRHGLEEYEAEALASLKNNLKAKWDCITMQAEEQVKIAKERKKGDKIIADSQERAFWRVYRPPPGVSSSLEPCPVPSRDRQGRARRRTLADVKKEVELLRSSLTRTRVKVSQAVEGLIQYAETYAEYDPMITPSVPSNPWVSEDTTFWQLNGPIVEQPTEKRVRRWAHSMEELVSDPTGLQEFTAYLRKEYSHENIRFWTAANDLRRSAHSQIQRKVKEIYEEFLAPGAPCEINIDGKTMERVQKELKAPTRFAFDAAAEHVYALLLKKDCYPRFVRSEHYKQLLAAGVQPSHKKRFFGFGGAARKKTSTTTPPNPALLQQANAGTTSLIPHTGLVSTSSHASAPIHPVPGATATGSGHYRRRGSDRSLSGSAHELAVGQANKSGLVPHSHSQSNLSDIPYSRDPIAGGSCDDADLDRRVASDVCPWETGPEPPPPSKRTPMASTSEEPPGAISPVSSTGKSRKSSNADSFAGVYETTATVTSPGTANLSSIVAGSATGAMAAAAVGDVAERLRRTCGIRQSTLDSDNRGTRRLSIATHPEQRRASVTLPSTTTSGLASSSLFLSADHALALPLLLPQSRSGDVASATATTPRTPRTPAISVSEPLPGQREDTLQEQSEELGLHKEQCETQADTQLLLSEPASTESTPLPSPSCLHTTGVQAAIAPLAEVEMDPSAEEDFALVEPQPRPMQNVQVKLPYQKSESSKTSEENITKTSEESASAETADSESKLNVETDASKSSDKSCIKTDDKNNAKSEDGQTEDGQQAAASSSEDDQRREVCPWEDEETCLVDTTPFVKTYATLGYL